MILHEQVKRVCIYFIYDKDGVIDDYIIYQLQKLRPYIAFLYCVINGKLTWEGRKRLEMIVDESHVRENKGNDVGAYKVAIQYIGWDKLNEYDELLLMNDTCFGPIYPFSEVFDWAKEQDVDFWALTPCYQLDYLERDDRQIACNSETIFHQSYFRVIRKSLLGSHLLKEFFDALPENDAYMKSVSLYETAFPGWFEDRGYRGAVYCNIEDKNNPLLYEPLILLKKYRTPLFFKRNFFQWYTDTLYYTAGEGTDRLLDFLEKETDYNMALIWQALLRTENLSDLVQCAHLHRVLPRDIRISRGNRISLHVGVVYHAYYEDLFDETIEYIRNFPENAEILFTTDTEEKKAALEAKLEKTGRTGTVRKIENRGRDVSSLLVGAADFVFQYDLVCFAHDKKSKQLLPHSVGRSWAYKLDENLFATKEYVSNVIEQFATEPWLGMAFPAPPHHGIYAYVIGDAWGQNFENAKNLLKDFGIHVKINPHKLCVAPLGTCFWFRPQALKKLFAGRTGQGWRYIDFPPEPNKTDLTLLHAIERAYAYFAQDVGFYSVYLHNDKYVQIELSNLEFLKSSSTEMRAWESALAMDKKLEDVFHKSVDEVTTHEVVAYYAPTVERYKQRALFGKSLQKMSHYVPDVQQYGIRDSLRLLFAAIGRKYTRFWAFMSPMRYLGKCILKI